MSRRLGRWVLGAAAIVFGCVGYAYLTLPDVRVLATENPTSTAFTELRAREARADGKTPKHVQTWIAYRRISPALTRAVLVAEDAAFWQHDGVDYDELQKSVEVDWARGQLTRGASTITQQLAKNLYLALEESAAEVPRADHREAARSRALQTADLRALPQRHRVGRRYLRRRRRGAGVLP